MKELNIKKLIVNGNCQTDALKQEAALLKSEIFTLKTNTTFLDKPQRQNSLHQEMLINIFIILHKFMLFWIQCSVCCFSATSDHSTQQNRMSLHVFKDFVLAVSQLNELIQELKNPQSYSFFPAPYLLPSAVDLT